MLKPIRAGSEGPAPRWSDGMKKKDSLPDEFFDFIPALYPRLIRLFQEAQLTPPEFFALSYVKRFGRKLPEAEGEKIILRFELGEVLQKAFAFKHKAREARVIEDLANRGFITQRKLSENEKERLFGRPGGRRLVVILLPAGLAALRGFNQKVNERFLELVSPVPRPLFRTILPLATKAMAIMLRTLEESRVK